MSLNTAHKVTLTEGQIYVPILNKSFNKLGEEIENSMAFDQHYFIFKEDIV